MKSFLHNWAEAAYTTVGFFWMALWAFALGYALSSAIQVFVTKERMQAAMGKDDPKSVGLGTLFGFLSSSCSFSALATTKSLFQKGAGFISSIAFLLASTNLVIELGIIISIFLGWQFVVGEYVGGILLILISWLMVKIIRPKRLIKKVRDRLSTKESKEIKKESIRERLAIRENWRKVGMQYGMEWKMVWKDVTFGFTVAGVVAVFVPDSFFEALFINSGEGLEKLGFLSVLQQTVVGPIAAFLTFIGSMGNIPLAALLFDKGVSFAGVMAFIFSDLVVFPVLRINARYYGWKMSLFILMLLFISLIATSLILHYGFDLFSLLPGESDRKIMERHFFEVDYGFYLNILFLLLSGVLIYMGSRRQHDHEHHEMASKSEIMEKALKYIAWACYLWLSAGILLYLFY